MTLQRTLRSVQRLIVGTYFVIAYNLAWLIYQLVTGSRRWGLLVVSGIALVISVSSQALNYNTARRLRATIARQAAMVQGLKREWGDGYRWI